MTKRNKCLICESSVKEIIDFGKMPIANGFLTPDNFKREYFFNLILGYCSNCHMVQLMEFVDREKMFHKNYAFFFIHIFTHDSAFQKVFGVRHEQI